MTVEQPVFMENEEWYYFDESEFCFKLTKEAPEEAQKSYDDFYAEIYHGSEYDA